MKTNTLLTSTRHIAAAALVLLATGASVLAIAADKSFQVDGTVVPFKQNGLHDPSHEAITVYQHPSEAMKDFPRTNGGVIDWVKALDQGKLVARSDKNGVQTTRAKELDVIMKNTGTMPNVLFPHRQHTELMTCNNCHPDLFQEKAGTSQINMNIINTGKSCGLCHGKVAFPPTRDCIRCHSVPTSGSLQLK